MDSEILAQIVLNLTYDIKDVVYYSRIKTCQ